MEFRQIMKVLLRWWWLVILPVIVVGAYIGMTLRPPAMSYQVVMQFATESNPAGLSEDYDRYYSWLTSEYIANGLADIAKTGEFAEAVAERLLSQGLEINPSALQGAIASDNAQSIMRLYITWPDAEALTQIATAASTEITQKGGSYYRQMQGVGPVAHALDQPTPIAMPPSLRSRLMGPGLRLILAGGIGLALAFAAHYLDPIIRERDDVEASDIPVLVEISRGK
jgi:capsular polysaccharide biosynthesis protein